MKKPWHNRNNVKRGRHRKSRLGNQASNAVIFQQPTPVPVRQSRFGPNGKPGTRPQAVIIDMDGTLENWDGHPNPPGLEYAKKHHAEGRVLIILTARDHDWSYQRTHDWLVKHLDIPFVGPICRPNDDERYACDFKRHVHDQLSAVYKIVSAIDDDNYVLQMWRSIPGLEVVETSYSYGITGSRHRFWDDESTARSTSVDVDQWEPDDEELAWLAEYEREIQQAKRRKPQKPQASWVKDWADEIDGLDLYCNRCEHPWFEHDITGCNANDVCCCAG